MKPSGSEDKSSPIRLIHELEDGAISPDDRARLMGLMREDEEVIDLYLEHVQLTTLIHQAAESKTGLGTMPISSETLRREKRRSAMLSLSYAAAALVVAGLGLLLYQVSSQPSAASSPFVLEGSVDAAYAIVCDEESFRPRNQLLPGDQITLERGLLRVKFPSGVEAIIEGPSQLELISETTLRMDKGLGWFRVPENAHGFTVRTDLGRVVDLGTEFGVRFGPQGDLEVHVGEGRVMVAPSLPGATEIELVEGDAMSFDSAGMSRPLELRTCLFRQQFSTEIPHMHWSFDALIDGAFPAQGTMAGIKEYELRPQHLDGDLVSEDDCLIEGIHGRAFALDGDGRFAISSFPGIEAEAPRTVAVWVRSRHGISDSKVPPLVGVDPRTGLGATTSFGSQAYLLNYTNSGLTTRTGATGVNLAAGVTYELRFHAATLPGHDTSEYRVELVAFDLSESDEVRIDSTSPSRPGSVLATAEGMVTTTDLSEEGIVTFTAGLDDLHLGKELGIRLVKASGPALYDHIRLVTRHGPDRETVVFTENFESPRVTGFAERTQPSQNWIGAHRGGNIGFGSERHGLFSQRPVFSRPLLAWGQSNAWPAWSLFPLPSQSLRWSVTDPHGFHDAPASTPIARDKWTHVAIVHTGRNQADGQPEVHMFFDGVQVSAATYDSGLPESAAALDEAARLFLGALPGASPGDLTLDADIDELHILRAALGEKEVWRLMDENLVSFKSR